VTTRVLPTDEWPKLSGTDFGPILGRLNPEGATIVVAEEGEDIVGCWGLITFAHAEGLWVAPSHRKRGRVLVRLWNAMLELTRGLGVDMVYTGALSGDVARLLESRKAEPLPPMYALPMVSLQLKRN
jgi:hypothetical protein